jgi:ornithine carbamoyltransferase
MSAAVPKGYEPNPEIVKQAREDGRGSDFELVVTNDPAEAVGGADAIYTDVWTSMGQEAEKEARLTIFSPYQVNEALMSKAKDDCVFMHCLPPPRRGSQRGGFDVPLDRFRRSRKPPPRPESDHLALMGK